jgi:hypothetical protein
MSEEIRMEDYSPERVAERISEMRRHLRDDLLPEARKHPESSLLVRFVEYLDRQAERFETSLTGPTDILALTTRNLLEFFSLLNQIFINQKTRDQFIGEMYVDAEEIRVRAEKMGIPKHMLEEDLPEWKEIPQKRLLVMRDKYDEYMFKLCSKCIHPSALSILAEHSMPGRFMFYFFGFNYLGRSYNFLVERVFYQLDAPDNPRWTRRPPIPLR